MIQNKIFIKDSFLREKKGKILNISKEGGIILDECLFYATSGGQPGDSGSLEWGEKQVQIKTTKRDENGNIVYIPVLNTELPEIGETVKQVLDWEKRYLHMRMHTALHLLSVVIPLPVTGGAIRPEKGRLDFDMPNSPEDKEILSVKINKLIDQNFNVTEKMISEVELDNNQNLIKTMSVKPPKGVGQIRLIRIGSEKEQIDLQPCGGTHVKSTNEIGKVKISKIEKKGKLNRRVHIVFD